MRPWRSFWTWRTSPLGARDANYPSFDVEKVLERLLLKGHIVVKKAYCDFDRYKEFKRGLHEAAFELIEIPHVRQSGKNSADIRMVVDALDLCYTKGHVDTFVIISGDSDFSPLVSKLRENAKTVIGVGVRNSTSDLFINNCDEFITTMTWCASSPPRRGGAAPCRRLRRRWERPPQAPRRWAGRGRQGGLRERIRDKRRCDCRSCRHQSRTGSRGSARPGRRDARRAARERGRTNRSGAR